MKFTELPLIGELQDALKKKGYNEATPIQEQAIPALLAGQDVLGIAQTGTGKTAAFGLPILHNIATSPHKVRPNHVRALVLAPTRELAAQIDRALKGYANGLEFTHACVFGGVNQRPQEKQLAKGVDVLVATPGRLLDLHRQKAVFFENIDFFVLDEADKMLDMGFLPDIEEVIRHIKDVKQRLLFSATMRPEIEQIAKKLLSNPVRINITPDTKTVDSIEQYVYYVDPDNKNDLLLYVLEDESAEHVIVFTRTKRKADQIARLLNRKDIRADSIHGDKSQNKRTSTLSKFRRKKIRVLTATEIAARGLDVDNITHVINIDVPEDTDSYVHRIGRTGRAGSEGVALTFCSAKERSLISDIEKFIDKELIVGDHEWHSEEAQNSKQRYTHRRGPKPKRRGNRRAPSRRGGQRGQQRKPKNSSNTSRNKPNRGEKKRWGKNRRDEGKPPKPKRKN